MSKMNNLLIDKLNNLPQYSAEETGTPCLAFDDVEKIIKDNKQEIEDHLKCGLVFGGYRDSGEIDWIGTNEQWSRYDNGNFE